MAEFFFMPQASPTMEIGRLVSWLVKEGDQLSPQDVIAEVETDKATAEIETFDGGFLLKILRQAEEDVAVNTPIAIIGQEGEDISSLLTQFEQMGEPQSSAPAPASAEEPETAPANLPRPSLPSKVDF